jgi:hypothetical protein
MNKNVAWAINVRNRTRKKEGQKGKAKEGQKIRES